MYNRANTYGGWIGVDLDGTLARHEGGDCSTVGPPVPEMLARVKAWVSAGVCVKIVTARVSSSNPPEFVEAQRRMIQLWCIQHLGQMLKVTAEKDFRMICLWDDRAQPVQHNTGRLPKLVYSDG